MTETKRQKTAQFHPKYSPKIPDETKVEEPHDDARGQEAARVRGVRRGVRAQAVVGRAHQVINHTEFAMHL